jgi:Flp pilus assembly protein TadG
MVALLIVALIGLLGVVLDLGNLYVRKAELQNAADAAALAGARQINGQAAGLEAAVHGTAGAIALAAANATDFGKTSVTITDAHIRFGPTPDGPWSDLVAAKSNPTTMSYIKVDTSGIAQGSRPTWFMPVVNSAIGSTTTNGVAVAGAPLCEGLPIFICQPAAGSFKPGQSYFFGESPGYPIGPGNLGYFDPVPAGAPSLISGANDMRDIICAGKTYCLGSPATYTSLTQSAFGTMARSINTRFDDFQSLPSSLTPEICRPDTNVKEYPYTDLTPASKPMAWMAPPPDQQSEQDTGATLGVHWSAVRPTGSALAGVAAIANSIYPSSGTPYGQGKGSIFHQSPSTASQSAALSGRRTITMAIVSNCGSINGSGKSVNVIGFGRFFLPVKAVGTGSKKGIYVEYIETVSTLQASAPDIKLYR